jgi:hypothetical protein
MAAPVWSRRLRLSGEGRKVSAFIPDPETDVEKVMTSGAEGTAADRQGNVYGAEVGPKGIKKFVKKAAMSSK